jgi:hypothetical protein
MCFGASRRGSNASLSKLLLQPAVFSKNADLATTRAIGARRIPDHVHECAQRFQLHVRNRRCLLVILKHATVRKTEICLSDIFNFPRKSSRFNHFLDRLIWLLLAPEARFWELTGTISGTSRPWS